MVLRQKDKFNINLFMYPVFIEFFGREDYRSRSSSDSKEVSCVYRIKRFLTIFIKSYNLDRILNKFNPVPSLYIFPMIDYNLIPTSYMN